MNRKFFLSTILLMVTTVSLSAQQIIQEGKTIYLSNTLVVKVKNSSALSQLNKTLLKFSLNSVREMYPVKGVYKSNGTDILTGIYLVKYNAREKPLKLAAKVAKIPGVVW
ncbi:MAG: hypothetical protein P8078_00925, partial [bacterium]